MKQMTTFFEKEKINTEPAAEPVSAQTPASNRPNAVYLTARSTYGMHLYRRPGDDPSVFLVDENRGIRKMIIDSCGNIQNFPGIQEENFWVKLVAPRYLKPQVRFCSTFDERENGWIFQWQVQPDGWYWTDSDGFGAENDSEVVLYSYLDRNGDFTAPFRLYKLDGRGYALERFLGCHSNSQQKAMEAICTEDSPASYPYDLFPQLSGGWSDYKSEEFYHLRDREEALAYWNDPVLSRDMKDLAQAMLDSGKKLDQMMGRAYYRVWPSMTLFWLITNEPIFEQMLNTFCDGKLHDPTVKRLQREKA